MLVAEQRPPAKYFFKVSNQKEFLQIGESFLNDFNSGMKSFAITSTGYKQAQQRTILAIASFFDCSTPMKIAIITNQFEHSVFEELIKSSSSVFINLETHSKRVKAKRFFHHFDFILFDSIFNTNDPSSSDKSYEKSIKELVASYDLILWDIPELHAIKENSLYAPLALSFDSLSILVSQSLASQSETAELHRYFTNIGVNIKDLALEYTAI